MFTFGFAFQQYQEAGSYIVVEIEVIRPLVPKKDPSFLVQR